MNYERTLDCNETAVTWDLAEWVEEYGPALYRQAYLRVGTREVAEDLVQETFMTAHQKLGSFRGDCAPGTWLSSILRNKIIDRFRARSPDVPLSETLEGDGDLDAYFNRFGAWRGWFFRHWSDCPHEVLENKGFAAAVLSCLGKLPLRQRQVFMSRAIDSLSTAAICAEFEISEANLGVVMFRSRMQLRQCLEQNWFKPRR